MKISKNKPILLIAMCIISFLISCEKEDREVYTSVKVDNNVIAGTWYHSYTIDSIVLVFEENMMKEYIFNKNTSELLSRTDYGEYSLHKEVYNTGRVKDEIYISSPDSLYSSFTYYNISDKILTIRRGSSRIEFYKIK